MDGARPRDAAATKERILAAAAIEFAAKGISGARIDDIAERARANKRMLYHHFGSKEGLFREVLQRELSARIERLAQQPPQPDDRLERLVDRQAHHLADTAYVRLLGWEALEVGADPEMDDSTRAEWCRAWVDLVAAEQRAGRVVQGLDPAHLVLSELALTLLPGMAPQFTRWITGRDPRDPQFLAERQAFLREFGRRSLYPASAPTDASDGE